MSRKIRCVLVTTRFVIKQASDIDLRENDCEHLAIAVLLGAISVQPLYLVRRYISPRPIGEQGVGLQNFQCLHFFVVINSLFSHIFDALRRIYPKQTLGNLAVFAIGLDIENVQGFHDGMGGLELGPCWLSK